MKVVEFTLVVNSWFPDVNYLATSVAYFLPISGHLILLVKEQVVPWALLPDITKEQSSRSEVFL